MVHLDLMNKKQRKAHDKVQAQVDLLNTQFKVGETIMLVKDDGSDITDIIKHEFTIMCGSATAWLKDHGSYLAERVHKLPF